MDRRAPSRLLRTMLLFGLAVAGSSTPALQASPPEVGSGTGPLDGMVFEGKFGPKGGPADQQDTLHFGGGKFWSANCVPCGFPPGEYWVRRTSEGLHFRGTLTSEDSGVFTYEGVVRDEEIEVSINWRKERWYWTIDRDFWFRGRLAEGQAVGSPAAATKRAMGVKPADTEGCSP